MTDINPRYRHDPYKGGWQLLNTQASETCVTGNNSPSPANIDDESLSNRRCPNVQNMSEGQRAEIEAPAIRIMGNTASSSNNVVNEYASYQLRQILSIGETSSKSEQPSLITKFIAHHPEYRELLRNFPEVEKLLYLVNELNLSGKPHNEIGRIMNSQIKMLCLKGNETLAILDLFSFLHIKIHVSLLTVCLNSFIYEMRTSKKIDINWSYGITKIKLLGKNSSDQFFNRRVKEAERWLKHYSSNKA